MLYFSRLAVILDKLGFVSAKKCKTSFFILFCAQLALILYQVLNYYGKYSQHRDLNRCVLSSIKQ